MWFSKLLSSSVASVKCVFGAVPCCFDWTVDVGSEYLTIKETDIHGLSLFTCLVLSRTYGKELAIRCRWCWCFRCASPVCVCVSVACASARCVPHFKNRISLSFSPSEKIFALPFLLFSVSFFYSCHVTTCPLTFHPFSLEFTQSGEML